ncbi:hypothetical protein [Uliginosibacterium sediminicola]|uniref:Uncharacterized protein n=1 Tax=Uliginosibacterium sediminicola TaxID=2024550 RepID=A0ABU9Z3I2_9RHOO
MDNQLIQLVARLKIRLRQDRGFSVNTQKFFAERPYASQVLDSAEESDDESLVSLALEIRERLGWIAQPLVSPSPATQAAPASAPHAEKVQYVFGARSWG